MLSVSSQSSSVDTALVLRPRLLSLLESDPIPPIILILAPAGYGKTTLATQWMQSRSTPAAWFALSPEHNSPQRFLLDLLAALESGQQGHHDLTLGTVLSLIEEMAAKAPGSVLVLDDVHVIENQEVQEMLNVLVSRLPAGMHLMLLSRTVPPIPLARRRLSGEVREIAMADLSFTPEEIAALAPSSPGHQMDREELTGLVDRTGGWIAGIRLALASVEAVNALSAASIMDTWYAQQSLDDYVLEEVLASLPEELQDFLLKTVFLPHLDPSLCDYVLEIDRSAPLIAEINRRLAFLRPANHASSTLTYHALLAESAMRIGERRYPASERKRRHIRAAEWFERQDQWEMALEQAVEAENWESAKRYARVVGNDLMNRDLSASRRYWLEKLPLEQLLSDDDLARWYISSLFYTGQVHQGHELLARVRPRWEASDDPKLRGYLASCDAFVAVLNGNDGLTLRYLYTSLAAYPVTAYLERLHAWAGIMEQEIYRGNDPVANQAYRQALLCLQHLPSEQAWGLKIHEYRANHLALRGDLLSAIEVYKRCLADMPVVHEYRSAYIHARLAELYLERNDLDAATEATSAIEDLLERSPSLAWHSEVLLTITRVRATLGDMGAARRALRRAQTIQRSGGGPTLQVKAEAAEAWLGLEMGKPRLARLWAATFNPEQPWRTVYFGDLDPRIVWVRCAISTGDIIAADASLRRMIANAEETARWAEMVSLAMWQVVVSLQLGDEARAFESLQLALRHGRPHGFVRSFSTPGYDLSSFLKRAARELPAEDAAYIAKLLRPTTRSAARRPEVQLNPLPVPLTRREQEVLELMAGGLANQEIGERLFITEYTAKKHVSNILRKLDASNRTTAVSRALELGLMNS